MSLSSSLPQSMQAYDKLTTMSVLQSLSLAIVLCIGIWALIYVMIISM